jgi:hypothetical protein
LAALVGVAPVADAAGVTGTGTFGTTTFPWEGADIFDGSYTLEVPGA